MNDVCKEKQKEVEQVDRQDGWRDAIKPILAPRDVPLTPPKLGVFPYPRPLRSECP